MRLIDADKLIDYFYFGIDDKPIIDGISDRKIIDIIKNQPTAYDIDKVVKELEKSKDKGSVTKTEMLITKACFDKAIEIVKHGGADDDVCEWKLCDEESNVYDTSCRNLHILIEGTPRENNYEFCPYCGKKIKIAGD